MNGDLELTRDSATWRAWLEDFGDVDPRDTAEYCTVARRLDPGEAWCARYTADAGVLLYPFLKRPVPGASHLWDIATAYDFGGYLLRCPQARAGTLIDAFRQEWSSWCRAEHVVAEFVRLHPLRQPSLSPAATEGRFQRHQEHAVLDLTSLPAEPAEVYATGHRWGLRRSLRSELRFARVTEEGPGEFLRLYAQTMREREAAAYYHFPREYFVELAARIPGVEIFGVRLGEKLVAAALFLRGRSCLFYFLAASDRKHLNLQPNNLLLDRVIRWARSERLATLHLGGGSDSLRRFKMGFGASPVPFHIYTAVHDERRYEELVAAAPASPHRFFPQYRAVAFFAGDRPGGKPG